MIIVYKSKTDFTKRYASIISKQLNIEAISYKQLKSSILNQHETIIYGSRIHAGRVDGLNKILKLRNDGKIKNLIVFATGGTPNSETRNIDQVWSTNLLNGELEKVPHFYMQAGICYEKMGFLDRTLMKIVATLMKKKENKDASEEGFLEAISKSYDIVDEKYALPLTEYVKNNYQKEEH